MTPIMMAALFLASPVFLSCHDTEYLDVDPATGLHITGDVTEIDINSYRLAVTGKVEREISLTYDEILELLPRVTASPDLVCPGYFVDEATWSGVPFKSVLEMAGLQEDAAWVRMKSADVYTIKVPLEVALSPDSFLAYELQGQTLPAEHGFPLRAVFPGEDGNRWVKWILELVVE
jgi:DMSO/TMAO reductase YedYZ molybdopterin-dependent catalytic subunit